MIVCLLHFSHSHSLPESSCFPVPAPEELHHPLTLELRRAAVSPADLESRYSLGLVYPAAAGSLVAIELVLGVS